MRCNRWVRSCFASGLLIFMSGSWLNNKPAHGRLVGHPQEKPPRGIHELVSEPLLPVIIDTKDEKEDILFLVSTPWQTGQGGF